MSKRTGTTDFQSVVRDADFHQRASAALTKQLGNESRQRRRPRDAGKLPYRTLTPKQQNDRQQLDTRLTFQVRNRQAPTGSPTTPILDNS